MPHIMYLVLKITKLHRVASYNKKKDIFQKFLIWLKPFNDLKYNHMDIGCNMSLENDKGL